jgi:AcrR family transcriptional regulator
VTSELDDDAPEELTPLLRRRREAVLVAVQPLLAEHGVDVTMDQLADAADIGRRTLFRYFPSKEALVAAAVRHSYDRLLAEVFAFPPAGPGADGDADAEELVRSVLARTHAIAERMGRAHWQVAADPESHGELGEAVTARRRARADYVQRFTELLWERADCTGAPPQWLVDSFALVESLFAFQALRRDLGRSREEIVRTTSTLMVAALRAAVDHRAPEPVDGA